MKFLRHRLVDIGAIAAAIFFTAAGILVSVYRYWQYEVSFIDFGAYDQLIWKVSRFQEPVINHFIHGKINFFGDHLVPSVLLISPFYWLTDRPEMILIIQALAVGLSGIFLYHIGKHLLKNKLLALCILLSFYLFSGLQNAVITEFHELTVMTLPFMASIWAVVKNKFKLYYLLLIITLGFKEITFSLGIALGIALVLLNKKWRRTGIITILISVFWGLLAFMVIIPYFNSGRYLYASDLPEGLIGKLSGLVDHPLKRRKLLYSFLSFSFLPFFAPAFWLGIFQDYASRFLPRFFITRWDLSMHYNAQSAVWLAVSSIYGLEYLMRFNFIKKYFLIIVLIILLNSFFLFRFILHGPLMLALNPSFYAQTSNLNFLNQMVKTVPQDAFVMTHNNLATRFTHQEVILLSNDYRRSKPDYILLDLREGQSPNNFCCSGNLESAKELYENLLKDKSYKIYYKTKEQFIFKRK